MLACRCRWLEPGEREAVLHDAFVVMLEKERTGAIDLSAMADTQIRSYLTQAAIYRALDEGTRAERKRSGPLDEDAVARADPGAGPDELADISMASARVREIVAELPERRQVIVKLRFFFDRTPEEIADYLGISARVYRRELERAMHHIAERYELVQRGTFCDSRQSLIMAFVAGIAGPTKAREARDHLATCPACAHWAAELRETAQRVAELLPLPALAEHEGALGRVAELAGDLAAGAKQQAAGMVARFDLGGAQYAVVSRPGAAAATVAGCLAIGGGTYCVVEGIPEPVRGIVAPADHGERAQRQARRNASRAPVATSAPVALRTPAPTAAPKRKAKPRRRAAARPAPTSVPPTPTQREFSVEGSGQGVSARAAGKPPPAPARRPSGPPEEFDP